MQRGGCPTTTATSSSSPASIGSSGTTSRRSPSLVDATGPTLARLQARCRPQPACPGRQRATTAPTARPGTLTEGTGQHPRSGRGLEFSPSSGHRTYDPERFAGRRARPDGDLVDEPWLGNPTDSPASTSWRQQARSGQMGLSTGGDGGLTAEFPFTGSTPVMIQVATGMPEGTTTRYGQFTNQPHPCYGAGLLCVLSVPLDDVTWDDVHVLANDLNRAEATQRTGFPAWGAWCRHPGSRGSWLTSPLCPASWPTPVSRSRSRRMRSFAPGGLRTSCSTPSESKRYAAALGDPMRCGAQSGRSTRCRRSSKPPHSVVQRPTTGARRWSRTSRQAAGRLSSSRSSSSSNTMATEPGIFSSWGTGRVER